MRYETLPASLDWHLADLASFGRFVEIVDADSTSPSGGLVPFGWDQWNPEQRRFELERTGWDFVLKSRQMGFSTVELARDLQFARTHPGSQVLIVTHDRDEKAKFFDRLKLMADGLAQRGLAPAQPKTNTKTELTWSDTKSGVYITEAGTSEGAAQKTGRSGTVHRLHATEAAFWGNGGWGAPEETWASLDSALEHGRECVIESTANGADTWFHSVWLKAAEARFGRFRAHFFPWFEHPGREADPDIARDHRARTSREKRWEDRLVDELGITQRQLAWWRLKVSTSGLDKTLREHPPTAEAAFQSAGDSWIDAEWLDELDRHTRAPVRLAKLRRGEMRVYADPEPGEAYILAADVSEGVGEDEAAFVVTHHRSGEICAAWDDQHTGPKDLARLMAEVGSTYNTALAAPEIAGMRTQGREPIGLVTLKELLELGYKRIYEHRDDGDDRKRDRKKKRLGWPTDKKTRPVMLEDMKDGIEREELWSPDRRMVAEARSLVRDRYGHIRARAKHTSGGADDGLFFAWAIAEQVRQRARIRRNGGGRVIPVGQTVSSGFRT